MEKILIIKTGYTEFLEGENNSRKVSYGDVLRVTPLLHKYKGDHVTWVTDKKAFPLLKENPYINRLLEYDFTTALQLQSEEFDRVINLEKIPGICALSDKIRARRARYGFTFNTQTGTAEALDKAVEVLAVGASPEVKKGNLKIFHELLFEMVDKKWEKEEIILGYRPRTVEIYDVGLNIHVGEKWPTKLWPKEYWDKLESMLIEKGYKVSRQDKQGPKVLENLYEYMDWINSCKLIISCDSLGLHLSLALGKKVFGLFGPTPHREVYFHGRGIAILPEFIPDCMPCFEGKCKREKNCMGEISLEKVYNETISLLEKMDVIKRREYALERISTDYSS
ncbi:MAG: glycosyltransferase family 9 protein [archaeon]